VVNVWRALLDTVEQREKWLVAEKFLEEWAGQGVDVDSVKELQQRAQWGMKNWAAPPFLSYIGGFAELLSKEWISETHLDTFACYLTHRAKGNKGKWWIGGAYLAVLLKALPLNPAWDDGSSKGLAEFEATLTQGGYKHLLFPANLGGDHWIAVSVDIDKREFSFGMSSHPSGSRRILTCSRGLTPSACAQGPGGFAPWAIELAT